MNEKLTKVLEVFKDDNDLKQRGFLSSLFVTRPNYYTKSESVKVDIVRRGHKVAPFIKDLATGKVLVSAKDFTTKEFCPPVISLATPANLYDLMDRRPGETEYAEIGSWQGRLFNELKDALLEQHKMMSEALELQASQILQTGTLTLTDEDNNTSYVLNFSAAATHFPTVGTDWGAVGATPLADIESLCNVINSDGKRRPSLMLIGATAWQNLVADSGFAAAVRKDGLALGSLAPQLENKGAVYQGYLNVGSYRLDMYTYDATYEKLGSTTQYAYLGATKVVITAAPQDLDFRAVYGGVPTLGMKDPFRSIIPSEVTYENGLRVTNRVYEDEAADTFQAESKCRPLLIPVSIDRFGCLETDKP